MQYPVQEVKMPAYTAGQAARAAGVSTATITRALKKGTISGRKQPDGSWRIEPAELHRVFPAVSTQGHASLAEQDHAIPLQEAATPALQAQIDTLKDALSDARNERDKWREMAERLSLAPPAQSPKRSLWRRIFGD